VLELVQTILEVMGKTHLAPQVLNGATHEILHQTLDCSKAKGMLGWQSEYTLEDALGETIEWYKNWLERASNQVSALTSQYSQAR
jgi:CDP-glucose 4,6-dehydratase